MALARAHEHDDDAAVSSWTWNLGANLVEASRGYRRLLGIEHDHPLPPFHILPLLLDEERERVLDALFRTMAGEAQPELVFKVALRDGRQRIVSGTAHVVRDDSGMPVVVRGRLRELVPGHGLSDPPGSPARERNLVNVAIVGSDRLARLGIRSLLAPFEGLRVGAEFSPSPEIIASLLTAPRPWARFGAVIVDVESNHEMTLQFMRRLRVALPGMKTVARVRPEALETVGPLARAGVSRLVTSDVSGAALARMLTSSDQHPDALEAAGQLLPGESLAIEASHGLTDHEAQVLRMIARGYRNREIAAVLFISEPTVKRYTQQIYRKLGARDRAHAAALANRFRLD